MKLTHKLCGAVLLAAVGVAVAVPGVTKAVDASTRDGDMDIQFTRNTEDESDTTHVTITDSEGNLDTEIQSGDITRTVDSAIFGVQDVTPLKFGEHGVVTDGNDRVFWAKNYTEDKGVMANNVLIKDNRTDVLNHMYTLTAEITTELTTQVPDGDKTVERKLQGATLDYLNIGRKTNVDEALALPEDAIKNKNVQVVFGQATTIVNNDGKVGEDVNPDRGQGQTYIHFGKLNAAGTAAADQSVKLTVGKDQTIFQGNYAGVVTWVMTAAK
ncbi:hypothetical protein IGJ02_000490 [Enterococcus sp. DIV0724b]|uniref:WxL domain-containing protein n=1 Tax=Enterococcus sp. DIV0724b TaxID=2774694 RepID=UPI003D300E3F